MQYNQEIENLVVRLNRFRTVVPLLICGIALTIIFMVFGSDIPGHVIFPVSYTHLTLPTIYSV